ncbi:MAG: type III-A CRISPR-associated RAMP protein Csm5 [Desulfobacterota bacterium]|nr:type III-A CRISPR-associated RAMP protein Csm5 [Thermodesulfobacteriota bacterium]
MNTIRETYTCRITTITPVHIGSGNVLRENIDYIADKKTGRVTGLNMRKVFQTVEQMKSADLLSFVAACEKGDINDWFKKTKLNPKDFATFQGTFNTSEMPKEIREQQRNGFGIPYFPGSSLKGAFRTAIIVKLADAKKDLQCLIATKVNPKFADQKIIKSLLGDDPNRNLMRCISVGDALFKTATPKIGLAKIASMKKKNGFDYKPFAIAVECIRENENSEFQMSIDTYLLGDEQYRCLNFKQKLTFDFIREAIFEFTKKIIDHEIKFCEEKLNHNELATFYKNTLPLQLKNLKQNEIILNLGWGIGWEGMTGGLLTEDLLNENIRKNLKLAPHRIDFPFPKTRKIAQVDNKITPWGWIKITFESYQRGSGMPVIRTSGQETLSPPAPEPMRAPTLPSTPERPVDKFIKQIKVLKPTDIGSICQKIDTALLELQTDAEKKEFALAVKAHMGDQFKKSKAREKLRGFIE